MFGFAALAAVMPAHDDWLNDLSSTPPVSRTMHALTDDKALPAGAELEAGALLDAGALDDAAAGALLLAAAGALLLAAAGALAEADALDPALEDLLLLHAATAMTTMPVAATI
jgi:hypothetical protein